MTAWQILTSNSLAPVGSIAWIHLNNQDNGGGVSDDIIVGGILTSDIKMSLTGNTGEVLNSNLLADTLSANIVEDLTINLEADIQ